MNKCLLFTPGPVNIIKNIKEAISKDDICHREPDFNFLLQNIEYKLLALLDIKDKNKYCAVVITGSGTAANESILSSVVGEKNILVISNGEFGDRLHRISEIYNENTFVYETPWAEHLDLKEIESSIQENKINIIAMVHHETSSGMLNPLEGVGKLAKKYNAIFVVDCVSSIGAENIDMEKCNISFCSGSSSKAIGSYPGVSFVIGKKQEFENVKNIPANTTYLHLYTFYNFIKNYSQTPNTPAVPLFFALEQALDNILNQGISTYYENIKEKANILRRGMEQMNLSFLINGKDMCSVLTTVYIPPHINIDILRQKLRDKDIIIYQGKGCFKHKVFQVGNIGNLSLENIQYFLDSLSEILRSFDPLKDSSLISTHSSLPQTESLTNNIENDLSDHEVRYE